MDDIRVQTVFPGWSDPIKVLVDIVSVCLKVDTMRRPKAGELKDQMAKVAEQFRNAPPEK
jgi:hypothetical protein